MIHNKPIVLVMLLFICPSALLAQRIKLASAVQHSWMGGAAGRSGNNYTFTIDFTHCKTTPLPDTIWLGQQPIPLTIADSATGKKGNVTRINTYGKVRFVINVANTIDKYAANRPINNGQQMQVQFHAPVPYKGIALLSYQYKGRPHYYTIIKATGISSVEYP